MKLFFFFFLIAFASQCIRCKPYPSPDGYDLNKPIRIQLDPEHNEISGLDYCPSDSSIIFISDAKGSLYKIFPNKGDLIKKRKFGKNADFEALQLVDSTFYILSSNGNLQSVVLNYADKTPIKNFVFPYKGKNEFESIWYNKDSGELILLCKDCEGDKKSMVSFFTFKPVTGTYAKGLFKFDFQPIAKKLNKSNLNFKASAADIHPLTKEIFIISSIDKLLVITDAKGVIKNFYRLDSEIYKQPEGIAFTTNGDLLISNESAGHGPANILIMNYKGVGK